MLPNAATNQPPDAGNQSKKALRRFAKAFRGQLPVEAISAQLCDQLRTWPVYREAKTILAFNALPQEISLAALFGDKHKTWLLPRVIYQNTTQDLAFYHYRQGDLLESSRFGVMEPSLDSQPLADEEPIDLILLPGLMFDRNGNRLGYGMSFYDRFLQARFPQGKPASCTLAGIVADALLVPTLPTDPWDIPVDWVITEARHYAVQT